MLLINQEINSATLTYVDENGQRITETSESPSSLIPRALQVSNNSVAFLSFINSDGQLRVLAYRDCAFQQEVDVVAESERGEVCTICDQPTQPFERGLHTACARAENGLEQEEPYGHCDSCGAICDGSGECACGGPIAVDSIALVSTR